MSNPRTISVTPGLTRGWAAFSGGAYTCGVAKKSQAPDQVRGDEYGLKVKL